MTIDPRLSTALAALSTGQRKAVEHEGNISLLARPGSGKTRTVGMRLALAANEGDRRVAVASYTHVAVAEVLDVCRSVGAVIGPRHYVGTLHGLMIDYVLRPHGHLVCGCRGPIRVRDSSWPWRKVLVGDKKLPISVADFHFDQAGKPVCHTRPEGLPGVDPSWATEHGHTAARAIKLAHARAGFVSQSDALYWSLEVLRQRPRIAQALAGRFDELIVDEAQDTSDVQLACLQILKDTGRLRSLVLIADLEQSIYSFNGADPERFERFASTCGLTPLEVTHNFRSSRLICMAASGFTRRTPDVAAGPNKDCEVPPEVLRYPDGSPGDAVEAFRGRMLHYGLPIGQAVVLARSRKLRDGLNGIARVKCNRLIQALGAITARREGGQAPSAGEIRALEETLLWMMRDGLHLSDLPPAKRQLVRQLAYAIYGSLPAFDELTLAEWSVAARPTVGDLLNDFTNEGVTLERTPSSLLANRKTLRKIRACDQFVAPKRELEAQTVHSVKGRSIDSVLLVVEPRSGSRDRARTLCSVDEHGAMSPDDQEELRIGFVSVTRAERFCAVALPDSVPEDVLRRYLDMGFEAA